MIFLWFHVTSHCCQWSSLCNIKCIYANVSSLGKCKCAVMSAVDLRYVSTLDVAYWTWSPVCILYSVTLILMYLSCCPVGRCVIPVLLPLSPRLWETWWRAWTSTASTLRTVSLLLPPPFASLVPQRGRRITLMPLSWNIFHYALCLSLFILWNKRRQPSLSLSCVSRRWCGEIWFLKSSDLRYRKKSGLKNWERKNEGWTRVTLGLISVSTDGRHLSRLASRSLAHWLIVSLSHLLEVMFELCLCSFPLSGSEGRHERTYRDCWGWWSLGGYNLNDDHDRYSRNLHRRDPGTISGIESTVKDLS